MTSTGTREVVENPSEYPPTIILGNPYSFSSINPQIPQKKIFISTQKNQSFTFIPCDGDGSYGGDFRHLLTAFGCSSSLQSRRCFVQFLSSTPSSSSYLFSSPKFQVAWFEKSFCLSSVSSFLTCLQRFRNVHRVRATILQDDEEKVVVEESFKAETFRGKEPLLEEESDTSSSALEASVIKLEQGVNVFLTVKGLDWIVCSDHLCV